MKYPLLELIGRVVSKDDFEYEECRKGWNRSIEKYPLAFTFCKNITEVVNAIDWAKKYDVPIRIRSGRHNYEGFSTGNDVLVIDVSEMKAIFIDEDNKELTIEAGVSNEELYEALGEKSYPFPGGACPTVGVIGFVLGGGWGYSTRLFGLGCDSLIELQIITADGLLITASEEENEDLFWACRGAGGGNFGVVVKMKFTLPQRMDKVTLITGDSKSISKEIVQQVLSTWQNEFEEIERCFNGKISLYNSKEKGIGIKFVALCHDDKVKAKEIISKLKLSSEIFEINLTEMTFLDALRKIQYTHPDYEKYKSGGRFLYNKLGNEEINKLVDVISQTNNGTVYSAITLYGLGGAVMDKSIQSTSFFYRGAKFILGIQAVWEDDLYAESNRLWVVEKFNIIKEFTNGSFVNFPLLEQDGYLYEYYGENMKKLKEIKEKYDKENTFTFEHSIK